MLNSCATKKLCFFQGCDGAITSRSCNTTYARLSGRLRHHQVCDGTWAGGLFTRWLLQPKGQSVPWKEQLQHFVSALVNTGTLLELQSYKYGINHKSQLSNIIYSCISQLMCLNVCNFIFRYWHTQKPNCFLHFSYHHNKLMPE